MHIVLGSLCMILMADDFAIEEIWQIECFGRAYNSAPTTPMRISGDTEADREETIIPGRPTPEESGLHTRPSPSSWCLGDAED